MAVLLQGCLIAQQDERTGKTMETWMIVWAIVLATLIMIGFGAFRKWFSKSKIVNEVREGVASVQDFREKYPTTAEYEAAIKRELLSQGAEVTLLKQVLKDKYDMTIAQTHKSGEEPAHFVDRWLFSVAAPKRWDFIEGMLPYYFQVVQVALAQNIRPTPVINQCGGMTPFIQMIESEYIRGISPEELVTKRFLA